MKNDIEAQKQADLELFESDVKTVAEQLPNHKMKELTFTNLEQQMLAEQQTIIALASNTQNKIINEVSLKRIGVAPSPDIHIRYSISLGRFTCFTPKPEPTKK